MVVLAEATRESPAANRVLSRLAASHATGRRRLTGLARKLQKSIHEVDVHSRAGLYLGTTRALAIDTQRAGRVLEKIVRGLFFHEFQRPLPRDAEVTVEIRPSSEALASPQWRRVGVVPSHRLGAVFEYRYTVSPEDTDCTSWLFGFYDSVLAAGVTRPATLLPSR